MGEPKKYGVLVADREQVEEKPGENQKKRNRCWAGFLWTNFGGGGVEVEQMNLRNPVQRVSRVFGGDVEGSIKERLKDEAEEVERG